MEKKIGRYLSVAGACLLLVLVAVVGFRIILSPLAEEQAAMDSVDKETVIAAINKNLSPEAKISSLAQVSAIFVDTDETTIHRTAQVGNGDGARVLAKVYEWAAKKGDFVTRDDIYAKGKTRLTTYDSMYANLSIMAEEISTAESLIPEMD